MAPWMNLENRADIIYLVKIFIIFEETLEKNPCSFYNNAEKVN